MKQTVVEWLEEQMDNLLMNGYAFYSVQANELYNQAKEMENQQQGYSEEDMIAFGKSCFYKGFDKAENDDANCYTAFREEIGSLVEQFKKK
jgi:hypothetical protein